LTAFSSYQPLTDLLHQKGLDLYRLYLEIGGMPEAVLEYRKTSNLLSVFDIHNKILTDYMVYMAKFTPDEDSVNNFGFI